MTHAEIKKLLAGITPGEWDHTHIFAGEEVFRVPNATWTGNELDAKFIEKSPTIVTQLLKENEELRGRVGKHSSCPICNSTRLYVGCRECKQQWQ